MASPPTALSTLVTRFDPKVFDVGRPRAVVRLEVDGEGAWDVVLQDGAARLREPNGTRPDAALRADRDAWDRLARDLRGGMDAFRAGRLQVRHDLHLGVGFLAATAGAGAGEGGLRFRPVPTKIGDISIMEAGAGAPGLPLHGVGAAKGPVLPTRPPPP